MFWLTRPPYLRWAAAAAVVLAALLWDLRDEAEVPYPFTARSIAAGTPIAESMIEWRNLPEGAMALPDLSDPVAARDLPPGEPIVPSAVSGAPVIPDGWWSVPVPLSHRAVPGSRIRLIDALSALEVDGVVVAAGTDDLMSVDTSGLVAVPPDAAATVAIAAAEGTLVVLLEP
ncbi:MAG: SAF domain-containing protein [Acidimicrobiia bacterium]